MPWRQGQLVAQLGYAQLRDLAGRDVPEVADVLALIKGRAKAHLDLKETGAEDHLVRLALDTLGAGEFIITTPEDASIAAIRSRFPAVEEVPVALTLRANRCRPMSPPRTLLSELRPWSRVRACGVRQCRRRHLKVMVWTVNSDCELRYWLSRSRADVLVTDRPARAVALRGRARPARSAWPR